MSLLIKDVPADAEGVRAVCRDPMTACDRGIVKIQDLVRERIALKADARGDYRLSFRRVVNGAVGGGGELHPVFAIEDHAVNGGRELRTPHAVENDIAHSNLPLERLSTRLRLYNARQPIQLVAVVNTCVGARATAAALQRDRPCRTVPAHVQAKAFGDGADGYVNAIVHNANGSDGVEIALAVLQIERAVGGRGDTHAAGRFDGGDACGRIPGDAVPALQLAECTEGNVGHAVNEKDLPRESGLPALCQRNGGVRGARLACRSRRREHQGERQQQQCGSKEQKQRSPSSSECTSDVLHGGDPFFC